jgi:predicted nucleic acid-binding protein
MDAFDADVLIYAAVPGHPLGRRVLALLAADPQAPAGVGSTLLLPEILSKPLREGGEAELLALTAVLGRLELRPLDEATAQLAVALGASYRLSAPDAVHLASAVGAGAERFLTNNRRDFPTTIAEVAVTYPDELPSPA